MTAATETIATRAECEYCTSPATWILNVQWSVVDFLDIATCDEHAAPAERQWGRRMVEGLTAVITATRVAAAP